MATTDYDAPRRSAAEEADTESLDALTTARKEAQSPDVDLDETDTAETVELPGADLSGEELTMPVIPKQANEFTCASCFPGSTPPDRCYVRWMDDLRRLRLTRCDDNLVSMPHYRDRPAPAAWG